MLTRLPQAPRRNVRDLAAWALSLLVALFVVVPFIGTSADGVQLAANTLLTITMITREALRVLENNLTFTRRINRNFDDKFGVDGAKIGTVVNVRKPPKYEIRRGQALSLQDATETSVPVRLDQQLGVDLQFSSIDLALNIDDFSDRFISPAVARIANEIDSLGLQLYKDVWNSVGTPGITPNALLTYLTAKVKLDNTATPNDGQRSVVITSLMEATLVDALKGLFQQATAIAEQYVKGEMGRTAGFTFYMDQNVATHTVGPLGGAPTVTGAGQTGSSLITGAWTAAAANRLKRGDIFTVAGVNQVKAQSGDDLGVLQQFVVTGDVDSDGAGAATIPIDPPIIVTGAFKTVTASPANGAALTIVGAANQVTPQGLAFHRDAFTMVSADLPMPRGVDMAARVSDKQLGISIRLVRAYDISTDNFPCRLDVLLGWSTLRPELACRIAA